MIPRVARLGHGFAGAGLYYLSDKRLEAKDARPTPDEYMLSPKRGQLGSRVGFTETRNLPTRDPHKALRCMQWLAAHAHDVRLAAAAAAARAAGMSYEDYVRTHNPFRGRRGTKPVYTLSIAWHPSKDQAPTRQQMVAAGDEVLRQLSLADRQCLMVSHTDTAHPHLHLIVNRVSPINGKFAGIGNDWLKLSAWALDYERRTGQVLCIERMLNWEKRRGFQEAKAEARQTDPNARGRYVRGRDTPRSDHEWWRAHRSLPDDQLRKARASKQDKELSAFQIDMARGLVKVEARLTSTVSREIATLRQELDRRQDEHQARAAKPARRAQRAIHAIRRMADFLTGRSLRQNRAMKALTRSIAELERRIETERSRTRSRYAKAWTRLEKRHAAERARDERRIAARGRKERGDAAIQRARKQFNLRSHPDMAKAFLPRIKTGTLSKTFRMRAMRKLGEQLEAKAGLARIVETLGGQKIDPDQLRKESLAYPPAPPDVQGRMSEREAQIAAEMRRLEDRKSERVRRRRARPRGRSRRMT